MNENKREKIRKQFIDAKDIIRIIKDVLNGEDVNKLKELKENYDWSVINWFGIEIDGQEVPINFYLLGKDLVDLFHKDQKIFRTIVSLEPAIDNLSLKILSNRF